MVQSIEIEAPRRPELIIDGEASRLPIPLLGFVNSLRGSRIAAAAGLHVGSVLRAGGCISPPQAGRP